MATSLFLILLLCIATLLLPFTDADVALDMQSLLAFKSRITHDPFQVLHSWHQNSPNACNWTGVSCSSKHPGRVIGLQLFNNSLGGVIAPEIEFGAGEASVKGDIYSFGVIMLEVITRVKPTDAMFVDNLNLCNWVAAAFQGDANRMQLESVLNVKSGLEITEEEEWIIVEKIPKIGVSACSHLAEERPAMDKIEGMLALLCDAKKEERVGQGNLDAILASSLQPIQQVPESEYSSTFE